MPNTSHHQQNTAAITSAELAWLKAAPARRETYWEIRISRKILIALVASLLVHALALYLFNRQHIALDMRPSSATDSVLSVQLSQLIPPARKTPDQATQPAPRVMPQHRAQKPKASPPRPPQPITAQPKSSTTLTPFSIPVPIPTPTPPTTATATATAATAAPTDMSSYINAVRTRRNLAEGTTGENAAPQTSADDIRMANIKRNLQPQGGGGIFQIKRMDARSGTFLFRGWGNTYTSPLRESITVEADANTDVEHAMIRKMISIIRDRHNGDFTWESYRLNRTVTLSARLTDNAGLEDFLMSEFFGAGRRPSEQ